MDLVQKKFVPATILLFFTSFWTVYSQELTGPIPNTPCPGEVVTFTCVTHGSPIIAWRSDDYIGTTQLEFAAVNNVGATDGNQDTAIATLTGNDLVGGVRVLTSELRIKTTFDFTTSSVSCVHIGSGADDTNSFQLVVAPNMPRDMVYDQRNDSTGNCFVHLSWIVPDNSATGDMLDYMVFINGTNAINESSDANLIATAYSVCNCIPHNISILAVNRCGHVGLRTPVITLESNPRDLLSVMCTDSGPSTESDSTDTYFAEMQGSLADSGLIAATALGYTLIIIIVVVMSVSVIIFSIIKIQKNKREDVPPASTSKEDDSPTSDAVKYSTKELEMK